MTTARRRAGLALGTSALVLAGAFVGGSPAQAAGQTLRVFDATVTEGTGGQTIVAFAVQLSSAAKSTVSFSWGTTAGTAQPGSDFVAVASTTKATIAKGATSTLLIVRVPADAVDEYSETFGVHLSGASSGVTISDSTAVGTIYDDDAPPVVSVTPGQIVEDTGALPVQRVITATLSQVSGKPISLRYSITGGTATIPGDLAGGANDLVFAPGVLTADITVETVADAVDEPDEAFALTWAAPINVRLPDRSAPIVLLDDDGPLRPSILGSTPPAPSPVASPLLFGLAPAGSTIEVFRNGTCAGSPIASGPADVFTGAGFAVPMTLNTTNTLTVKGINTVGGVDTQCSVAFTYRHDNVAPAAPNNLAAVPGTPTQALAPTLRGNAESGSTVSVFVDTDCSGTPVSVGTAADFGDADGLPLGTLTTDVAHAARVSATDAAGNTSACSAPLTVTIDTIAPLAPTGLAVVPSAVTSDATPALRGTAEVGSTVQVFVDNACTGTVHDTGSAAQFALPAGIGIAPALTEATHTLQARAIDQAGNVGPCSAAVTVTIDQTPPAPPAGLTLVGPSPTTDTTPRVRGTAEAGSTVTVYRDNPGGGASCDDVLATGTATDFGDADGVAFAPAVADGTYVLRATATDAAGQESACSTSTTTVVVDNAAPDPPVGVALVGPSPTADSTPGVRGTAEPGSTVTVFVDTGAGVSCDDVVGSGTAADFADPSGIVLTTPLVDGTSELRVTATDGLGHESVCSTESASVTVDTTGPAGPTALALVGTSPTSDPTPRVRGVAEPGSTVELFLDTSGGTASCDVSEDSGSEATFSGAGLVLNPALSEGPHVIRARATDALGNVGPCSAASVSVTVDTVPPAVPTGLTIVGGSPIGSTTFGVRGSTDAGTTVTIYRGAGGCSQPVATGTAAEFNSLTGIDVTLPEGSYVLRAVATDDAALDSGCSDPVSVDVDLTAPNAPNGLTIVPGTPTSDRTPALKGNAEAGSVVHVFVDDLDCSGTAAATNDASTFGSSGVALTSNLASGPHTLSATATDAAGNESACSSAEPVVIDFALPVLTGFALVGSSPTNDATPDVTGSVSEDGTVSVYDDGTCTGTPVRTGSVTAFEGGLTITPALGDGTYTWWAQATDLAGNVGACEGAITVVVDTDPPPAPIIDATIPGAPTAADNVRLHGSAEVGGTVRVFLNGGCTGTPAGSGPDTSFAGSGLPVGSLAAATYTASAEVEDAAGNVSPCSSTFTFDVLP